jgi:hypothetical protein
LTIGLFTGLSASIFLIVWSAVGNWAAHATPMWFMWLGAPVLLVAGLVLAALGRITRFFPVLWSSFSTPVSVASLASAAICFTTGQAEYGPPFLVWMVVLAATFYVSILAGRERWAAAERGARTRPRGNPAR